MKLSVIFHGEIRNSINKSRANRNTNYANIRDCGETTELFPCSPSKLQFSAFISTYSNAGSGTRERTETAGTPLEYRRWEVTKVS